MEVYPSCLVQGEGFFLLATNSPQSESALACLFYFPALVPALPVLRISRWEPLKGESLGGR
jgi:hypothetical protein